MKILLFNSPVLKKFSLPQRSPSVTKSGTLYFPMWLAYAAGGLNENGFEVDFINAPCWRLFYWWCYWEGKKVSTFSYRPGYQHTEYLQWCCRCRSIERYMPIIHLLRIPSDIDGQIRSILSVALSAESTVTFWPQTKQVLETGKITTGSSIVISPGQ